MSALPAPFYFRSNKTAATEWRQCVFIDPVELLEMENGSASLIAASEDTPERPESIELVFEDASSERLRELTGAIIGQTPPRNQMVIAVEDKVVAMPAVMDEVAGGIITISGDGLTGLYDRLTA